MKRWYQREWTEYETVKTMMPKFLMYTMRFEDAVQRQLMSDVPYGVLLREDSTAVLFLPLLKNTHLNALKLMAQVMHGGRSCTLCYRSKGSTGFIKST